MKYAFLLLPLLLASRSFCRLRLPIVVGGLIVAISACVPADMSQTPAVAPSAFPPKTNLPPSASPGTLTASTASVVPLLSGTVGPGFSPQTVAELMLLAETGQPLPFCQLHLAGSSEWAEAAAGLEAQGAQVDYLTQLLAAKLGPELKLGAKMSLCETPQGWFIRMTTKNGTPFWSRVQTDKGTWRCQPPQQDSGGRERNSDRLRLEIVIPAPSAGGNRMDTDGGRGSRLHGPCAG